MPTRAQRNKNVKRRNVRLPGGRSTIHYGPGKYRKGNCASCGRPLGGVPASSVRSLPKTARRPSRPFAGYFCHSCLKEIVRQGTRAG